MFSPLLSFALCLGLGGNRSDGPSMFRFDPGHSGVAQGPARLPGEQVWSLTTKGKVRSTPMVAGGRAYFGSDDGVFRAVDLRDGKEIWRFETGCEIPCSPAGTQGMVFFQGRDNQLRALDARDGHLVWRYGMGPDLPGRKGDYLGWDYWVSSPTVAGETVYIGGGDGKLHAVDLKTGQARWTFATAQRVRSSPAVAGGRVYVGSFDGHVYAVDAETGKECWKFDTGQGIQSSPAVVDGTVFIGSRSAAVYALDALTGAMKWRKPHPNGSWVLGSPAVTKGKVIVGSSDEQFVHALDARTGEELWRLPVRFRVLGSPVVVDDLIYFGTEGASVYAIDLETGWVVGTCGTEGPVNASLLPVGDRFLVPSDDNKLHAFKAEPQPPMRPGDAALMEACTGTFALGQNTRFTLSLQKGRLRFEREGFPPSLARITEGGKLLVPADGLEASVLREGGSPAQLVFHLGGKDMPATRLR